MEAQQRVKSVISYSHLGGPKSPESSPASFLFEDLLENGFVCVRRPRKVRTGSVGRPRISKGLRLSP